MDGEPQNTPVSLEDAVKETLSPQAKEVPGASGGEASTTPQSTKTFTQEDVAKIEESWKSRYGGLDKKLTNVTKELQELRQAREKETQEAQERNYQTLLKRAEDEGADVELVKSIYQREKDAAERLRRLAEREQRFAEQAAILTEVARNRKAQELLQAHELPAEALSKLVAVGGDDEAGYLLMEKTALELANAQLKSKTIPTTKTDKTTTGQKPPTMPGDSLSALAEGMKEYLEGR